MSGPWTVLGAPLDSSGAGRGEERAPEALRAAGLAQSLQARDEGDVVSPLHLFSMYADGSDSPSACG